LHFKQDTLRGSVARFLPHQQTSPRSFPGTLGLLKGIRDQLLQSAKEPHVVGTLCVLGSHPRSVYETREQVPVKQAFHVPLELLSEFTPIASILGMGEQSCNEIDIL